MSDSFKDVSGTSFTFGSDHGSSFRDSTESFSEVSTTTDERDFESVLVDVVLIISHSQDLALINIIHSHDLQDLSLEPEAIERRAQESRIGKPSVISPANSPVISLASPRSAEPSSGRKLRHSAGSIFGKR